MTSDSVLKRKPPIESAAVAGIVYSVLSAVAVVLFRQFEPTLPDQELLSWFGDEGNRWWPILGLNLATISSVAFLWFVAVIRRRIGDREDRFLQTVFLGSAFAWVFSWLAGAVSLAAIPLAHGFVGAWAPSPDAIRVTFGLAAGWLLVVGPKMQAVLIFSASTVFVRTKAVPIWLAYVGYAMGLVLFFMPLIWRPIFLGFPIWVLIVSVTILFARRSDQPLDDRTAGA